jgi:ornithine decarboxylase
MISVKNRTNYFSQKYLNALEYRTPFFLYDLAKVAQNYGKFQSALKKAQIFYAVKANAEPALLHTLDNLGAGFEIASYNELRYLHQLGIKTNKIMYSNPVKPADQIKSAHELGVTKFAFDTIYELDKIAQNAPGTSVYLRFVVNDRDSTFPLSKKFGAEPQDAVSLMQYAQHLGLVPYGLTFHVGSQSINPRTWESAIQDAGDVMRQLEEQGIKIQMIDLGGGFPADYGEEIPSLVAIGMIINRAVKSYLPYQVTIAAEPGRAMVADTAVLVTSVMGKAERGNKNWLYLDVGAFNGMMESLETENNFRYPLTTSIDSETAGRGTFTLTGPTCDTQDTLFYDIHLPRNLTIGDRVFIHSAGAYTSSYASSFNGFGPPKSYFVNK